MTKLDYSRLLSSQTVLLLALVALACEKMSGGPPTDEPNVSPNSLRLLSDVANGPATWVFIGDSITYGTGATNPSTSWTYQVVNQIQKLGNYYGGAGFCSTEGTGSCGSTSTGTWTVLQGAGPSQTVAYAFGETKTGSSGATWTTGPYTGTIIDVLYYTNAQTTSTACQISIDGQAGVKVGGATKALTPQLYTVSGLDSFAQHTVTVTSDGSCNLSGLNFRTPNGLQIWNTARGGATSSAFSTPSQLSWLTLVPNLAGIFVALGQNDPGGFTQAQSLANIQAIVTMNQSLANPVPMFFVYTEAPKYDGGQGALYTAIQSNIAAPNGYDGLSIYSLWGANSYNALPNLYVGGTDVIHPSQAGHDAIANAVLNVLGVPPTIDSNASTIVPYGSLIGEKDQYGNTVSIASVSAGNTVNLGGSYSYQVNIGTGGAGGTSVLQILNNGHIAITPAGAPPTVSGCGKQPTVSGNDVKGQITEGTGATGCQITFGTPYSPAPSCVVSMQSGPITYSTSASALTVLNRSGTPAGIINYLCF